MNGSPFPPRGGRWPEGPDEGIERSEMASSCPDAIKFQEALSPKYSLALVLTDQSHLAPLDPPHPSLLRNDTFPRKGGRERAWRLGSG